MAWVRIHPDYRDALGREGLRSAEDFLRLSGVILCGHPDRHVLRLEIGGDSLGVFLKKEHRVPWRERLASWRIGFGFASRSAREARLLGLLQEAGIEVPEVLAVGEGEGRAFLLLRECRGAVDLRLALQARPEGRREMARSLGIALARMHLAGFRHPDLFAKHVLATGEGFCFLDWQRASLPGTLSEGQRLHNLAALDASMAEALASRSDRLACLTSYLRELAPFADPFSSRRLQQTATKILGLSRRLATQKRIRELRQTPLPVGQQNLIWMQGEQLCITRQLEEEAGPLLAEVLERLQQPVATVGVHEAQMRLGEHAPWVLVRRREPWFRSLLRRWRRRQAPEFVQAATLFRLERHGIAVPRLLAVGQDYPERGQSFLLTEPALPRLALTKFLEWASKVERRRVLPRVGQLLRSLHDAGYRVTSLRDFAVGEHDKVRLVSVAGLVRARRGFGHDFALFTANLDYCCTKTDLLHLRLGYDEKKHALVPPLREGSAA